MSNFDYSKYAGAGAELADKKAAGMPMLNVIQKGSPQFDETHRNHKDKRIEGCKPGDLVFTPTNEVLRKPVSLVITGKTAVYTEWKPKTKGGGIVATHNPDIVTNPNYRRGQPGTPTEYKEWLGENELVYTMYFMVMFEHAGKWVDAILSFTSKQLKKARLIDRKIAGTKIPNTDMTAPLFASKWDLITVAESNEKGGWFAYELIHKGVLSPSEDSTLLETAAKRYQEVKALLPGPRQASTPQLTGPTDTTVEDLDSEVFGG